MIKIIQGNNLDSLKTLDSKSINTCVTSPPYFGLRDYGTGTWIGGDENCPHKRTTKISKDTSTGHKGMSDKGHVVGDAIYKSVCPECGAVRKDQQLGLEDSPKEFVQNLVILFREISRVLRDDGTVWLNLGDTYCGTGHKGNHLDPKNKEGRNAQKQAVNNSLEGFKSKDLIGIPWRVAFALQEDGWYLRQDIIWHKPNPMPESVRDRCTKSHEYIFLLSKKNKYYYDNEVIKEPSKYAGDDRGSRPDSRRDKNMNSMSGVTPPMKNKRSVWTVSTKPYKGAHFATFPMDLIEPCVLAGCPEKVCVDCNEPYINTPMYEFVNEALLQSQNYGKYETQDIESSNRQGLHANRGSKLIEIRENLPQQSVFVDFLRSKTNPKLLAENSNVLSSTIEHWFRRDESGFAYPTIDSWKEVKDLIDDHSDEFYKIDIALSNFEYKTDAILSKKIIGYEFIKQCICKTSKTKGGTVLDPFGGAATTGVVAENNKRNAVLLELNPEYIEIAEERIAKNREAIAQAEYEENLQAKFDF